MAFTQRNRTDIISDLVKAFQQRDPAIETSYGPIKDLIIDPISLIVANLYTQIKSAVDSQFIQNANIMDNSDLDLLGNSFGIVRKSAQTSTGTVLFYTSNRPQNDITIPPGIPIATGGGIIGFDTPQSFVTTRAVTLPGGSSADVYFNAVSGYYEIEAPVESILPGIKSNVAARTITVIQRPIPGISGVYNSAATSNGNDSESNVSYARRIQSALRGTDKGTVDGLRKTLLTDSRVLDAAVLQSDNPLVIRAESVAAAVDIYIRGEDVRVAQQVEVYTGADIVLDTEPLVFPNPIISILTNGALTVLTENVHYTLIPDLILSGSTAARNILRFRKRWPSSPSIGYPNIGDTFTIQYQYDQLIRDLQETQANILANILFRRATEVPIQLTCTVHKDPSVTVLNSDIQNAIIQFVDRLGIGGEISASDIDAVIRSVPGVDFVDLPFTLFSRVGLSTSESSITLEDNEYATITSGNIIIN